jgi:hypothetical protein
MHSAATENHPAILLKYLVKLPDGRCKASYYSTPVERNFFFAGL